MKLLPLAIALMLLYPTCNSFPFSPLRVEQPPSSSCCLGRCSAKLLQHLCSSTPTFPTNNSSCSFLTSILSAHSLVLMFNAEITIDICWTFLWLLWMTLKLRCSIPWEGAICGDHHSHPLCVSAQSVPAWPQPLHAALCWRSSWSKQRAYANPLLSVMKWSSSYFRNDGRNNLSIFRNEHKCPL